MPGQPRLLRTLAVASAASMMIAAAPTTAFAAIQDGDGQTITDQGVRVELEIAATVPDNSFGDAPRLNMMTTLGERIFVVEERDGLIYELVEDNEGARSAVLFFDVAGAIESATDRQLDTSNVFHGGLRSLAFHPDFALNGLLYVSAMETRPNDPGLHHYLSDVPSPIDADSVLLEFSYDHDHDTEAVDPASYREVFRVGMPVYDHPIKQITFDNDATTSERDLLFIAHGDGSVLSAIAGGGQRNDALGKILRIDPRASGSSTYTVPGDNPFVSDPSMLAEVYSLGHRNPHHLAFARDPIDESRMLIVAEPGRDNVEEVNLIRAGDDYGWPQREGAFVHLEAGGRETGIDLLPSGEGTLGFVYPAAQYLHTGPAGSTSTGEAIAGGYVVANGSELSGLYFFADFPTSGALFHSTTLELATTINRVAPGQSPGMLTQVQIGLATIAFDHDSDDTTAALPRVDLRDVFDDSAEYETSRADVRFGQGPGGELYVMSKRNNTIYLVSNSVASEQPPADAPLPRYIDDEILRLYRAALGRPPDESGLAFWVDRYQAGVSLSTIASQFVKSPEFIERFGSQPRPGILVALLYQNVLGRPGETSGTMFWTAQLEGGMSTSDVVAEFANSEENIERTGTSTPVTSTQSKLIRLYRASLGRTPDPEGLGFWVDRYEDGATLLEIAGAFRRSPEFVNRYGAAVSDNELVDLLYRNVLGRSGEASGVQFWLDQLADGVAADDVLAQFSESAENVQRTNTRP